MKAKLIIESTDDTQTVAEIIEVDGMTAQHLHDLVIHRIFEIRYLTERKYEDLFKYRLDHENTTL